MKRTVLGPALGLLTLLVPAVLTGCSSAAHEHSNPPQSLSSSATPTCASLVGRPVTSGSRPCDQFAAPASAPCYINGQQKGSFYYYAGASTMVYGKDGGTWKSGPNNLDLDQMATALGCR